MRQLTLPSLFPVGQLSRRGSKSPRDARRTTRRAHRVPLRRRAPRWLGWIYRPVPAIAATATVLPVFAAVAIWQLGGFAAIGNAVEQRVIDWTASAGMSVQEVMVEGRHQVPVDQVLAALDITRGTPLFAFSPAEARERLLALGWVADARVERRLPGTVYVTLSERQPAAIWQNQGRFALVDRTGVVIGGEEVGGFSELRLIVGPDAPDHFTELFEILDTTPQLTRRLAAAIRVGGRRWNLEFDSGLTVLLPENDLAQAWDRFARAAVEGRLLERDIARIDLRSPDRFVVRLSPEAAQRRRDQGA